MSTQTLHHAVAQLRFKSQANSRSPLKRTVKQDLVHLSGLELLARDFSLWRNIQT